MLQIRAACTPEGRWRASISASKASLIDINRHLVAELETILLFRFLESKQIQITQHSGKINVTSADPIVGYFTVPVLHRLPVAIGNCVNGGADIADGIIRDRNIIAGDGPLQKPFASAADIGQGQVRAPCNGALEWDNFSAAMRSFNFRSAMYSFLWGIKRLQGQTADKIQQTPGVAGFIIVPDLQFYQAVLNDPGGQAMDNA